MTVRTAPHGTWPSPITPEMITRAQIGLSWAALADDALWWCESRPEEGGRVTLIRRDRDGSERELTPAPFNLRSRLHEYGGRAWAAGRDGDGRPVVVGVGFGCQRLFRLDDAAAGPQPLTPASDARMRYADLVLDLPRRRLLAVREAHGEGHEPVASIVAVPLDGGPHPGEVLCAGHDFFASPRLAPDGGRLVWLAWDHPRMPWNGTRLFQAALDAEGRPGPAALVAGGDEESVVQPEWSAEGVLHFVSDRDEWWNIYRLVDGAAVPLVAMPAEFAGPLWQLGSSWYGFAGSGEIIAAAVSDGRWRLGRIPANGGSYEPFDLPFVEIRGVSVSGSEAVMIAGRADSPAAVVRIDLEDGRVQTVKASGVAPVAAEWMALPESITFASAGGRTAHAFYYPPTNPERAGPVGELPPLIVRSHGGPTASASPALALGLQFWTSRGFAVVDVDYGGSTGHGRSYRNLLDGAWGIVDVEDCVAAAQYLVAEGRADPARLAIRGGSAGGYTTLAALTFTDTFKVGASAYGISDLETLAKDTHKFESRYLDRLVGPWPERADLYRARSPLRHAELLSCPVIFLQGLDDKVVPPSQALPMVDALRRAGLPVSYQTFAGEGHGFRKAETIQAALRAEHAFFCRIFGIVPEDGLAEIEIENLPG